MRRNNRNYILIRYEWNRTRLQDKGCNIAK